MITKIVQALNGNPYKTIVYGDPLPNPPYCVVKPEKDSAGRGVAFRIDAHFLPGQQTDMEDYIWNTVGNILDDFKAVDRNGNTNQLEYDSEEVPSDYIINNDDKTISMFRTYWMPGRIF